MWEVGIARRSINPQPGVELAGWGYYLQRTWTTVHDDLNATVAVIANRRTAVVLVSLDLMVIGERLTHDVRQRIGEATGVSAAQILVACTHSHNAPASQGLEGVGAVDAAYEAMVAERVAAAAAAAWDQRQPAALRRAATDVAGLTFNRTRSPGPVDTRLSGWVARTRDGDPLACLVQYQGHPTVSTTLRPRAVSRDLPGQLCDLIESHWPGVTAAYFQGACGDVNFLPEFSDPQREQEPAQRLFEAWCEADRRGELVPVGELAGTSLRCRLPTRRWMRSEIEADRQEAERRLQSRDLSDWRHTIGRVMTNRPEEMVLRHGGNEWQAVAAMCKFNLVWTERMLADLEQRPEWLETEVQALRIGDGAVVTNAAELFTSFAQDVRRRSPCSHLMLVSYANGRIGYMPDDHDIERRTYAAWQSPKYCDQFPFTPASGPRLVDCMLSALRAV